MDFHPKALLFGAEADVRRYNCLSRLISVIFNKTFGTPLLAYFDDFGAIAPKNMCGEDLETFETFCETLGIRLKLTKTVLGTLITP